MVRKKKIVDSDLAALPSEEPSGYVIPDTTTSPEWGVDYFDKIRESRNSYKSDMKLIKRYEHHFKV